MAVTFDTTIGGQNSTSYSTVAQATQHFEDTDAKKHANWNRLSEDDKKRVLNAATEYLDNTYLEYPGVIYKRDQALLWPRLASFDAQGRTIESTEIPKAILKATAECAYLMYDFDGDCPERIEMDPEIGIQYEEAELEGVGLIKNYESESGETRKFPAIDKIMSSILLNGGNPFIVVLDRA